MTMVELNEKAEEVVFCPNCGWNSAMDTPDDGLVERLRYRVENPSAWDTFDQGGSDLIAEAATALQSKDEQIERLTRETGEQERIRNLMAKDWFDFCEMMGVTPDTQEAVAYEIQTRLSNAGHDKRAADQQVQKLTAEVERLEANIVRLTGNPVDHRYWEGRYRDEKAEKATALGLLNHLIAWIVHECGAEVPFTEEQDAAFASLETQEGGK